ncbi:damage-inducible mutagenesis protein [Novosphingobium sp. PS1R-30]|uniref:Damage-inducible mutagenesis protein n=1 Tax=Novosphingobium anseongense TaxID=3133436 RepID=A0ABU8RV71_9SPHN
MRSSTVLHGLRAQIAQIEGGRGERSFLPFEVDEIDGHLPGGGLAAAALHEIAGSPELADDAAATVFLAAVLARLEGPIFWCLRWRDLFIPALHQAGLHPDRVIFVEAGSDTNVLLAMEECLRHAGLGGVVGEVAKYSTTASKRLQLAAEKNGVTAFVFRRGCRREHVAQGTAANTRWRITASASEETGLPSLGRPRWHVALERARGADCRAWIVEGADAQGRITLPAALVDRPAAQEGARAVA